VVWEVGGDGALREGPGAAIGGGRSVAAVRARFVVLKKLESLVAATLPLAPKPQIPGFRFAGPQPR